MVPRGSNADDVASAPNLLSHRVVPARFNVVPTMRKCWHVFVWQILCSSWLTAGLLLDAGSALAKGGQVMFRPQPLHQLPSMGICAHRCSTIVATLPHCRHLASGGHLACAWQSLGNRLAIAWQYYGNRSVFLAIAFLSHCRHTKMHAFSIGRRVSHPAQVPLL